jgi:hypothetical protein
MSVPGAREPADVVASWNDTPTRAAIVDFVERVTDEGGAHFVPPDERVAVFDNDGTLWCEKPMPVELGFILHRFAEMAQEDPALRERQPWKAAWDKDYAWLGEVITKHYHGDDSDVNILMGGILQAFEGMTVNAYTARADAFSGRRRTRAWVACCATAPTCRWSSCCATWRPTGSPPTSRPAATETSCDP